MPHSNVQHITPGRKKNAHHANAVPCHVSVMLITVSPTRCRENPSSYRCSFSKKRYQQRQWLTQYGTCCAPRLTRWNCLIPSPMQTLHYLPEKIKIKKMKNTEGNHGENLYTAGARSWPTGNRSPDNHEPCLGWAYQTRCFHPKRQSKYEIKWIRIISPYIKNNIFSSSAKSAIAQYMPYRAYVRVIYHMKQQWASSQAKSKI